MKLFTKKNGITINVSTDAIIRLIVFVLLAFVFIVFLGKIKHQIELFVISAFLAVALNPAVSWLSRRLKIKSRVWATGLAYIVVLGLLVGFLSIVVPPLVRQSSDFVHTIPNTVDSLKDQDSTTARFVRRYNLQPELDKVGNQVKDRASDAPGIVFNAAGVVGGIVISVLTIIVLTFMMLVEGPLWLNRLWTFTPSDKQDDYKELAHKMYRIVTSYVNGQVLIAFIAASFSMFTLIIAGHFTHSTVNAVALSGIVFLCGLIPLIGNTIAAVIVVIICLFTSVPLAIIMAVYYPVYQQIENATLQPHIQAKNNQLTPLLVFMSALIGAGFGGLLGAFIAIPAAGCLRVLFLYRYGDRMSPTASTVEKAKTSNP